ncbi:hypothetical protein OGAPHI_004965 [Ogataea philodendri]|uniref:Histidine biosynthesis trifunctional protein n=1 Tax=Ogataea philodendri TaxID=1378263 RepID=A0A9P8P1W2_9ASCO|nr:uncharacterized protein OGAPHI_004965 [Ogataea philodendri]KAH3663564.1 hypothetical protein OGAPHI_004965 [Ogataea philodendri]
MVSPVLVSVEEAKQVLSVPFVGEALVPFTSVADVSSIVAVVKQFLGKIYVDWAVKSDSDLSEELVDGVLTLLNNGVHGIFVDESVGSAIQTRIPNARLVIKNGSGDSQDISVSGATSVKVGKRRVFGTFSDPVAEIAKGYTAIIKLAQLTTDYEHSGERISFADCYLAALTTDRQDGLYTTLVTDSRNQALGLVYSSKKSISEAIKTGTGVYQSRKHGLWYKGQTSGATQKLLQLELDCDSDCLKFVVEQAGAGFCHLDTASCFGAAKGLSALESTLWDRKANAPEGSYTKRLFQDEKLLNAKIQEEADELVEATSKDEIAWEAADLLYFALTKCVKYDVSLTDIERNLDLKSLKVTRRKGDAKPKYVKEEPKKETRPEPKKVDESARIVMGRVDATTATKAEIDQCLQRPIQKSADIMNLVTPIVEKVRKEGDSALVELTAKFDKVELASPVLNAPFPEEMMKVTDDIKEAIDISFANIKKFHAAQNQTETLTVETCPGVFCSRFARPIEKVGCYIPGGTAVLPSTSLMLSVPALVAGCKDIVFASPPGKDGRLTPEVVYVAHKVGAKCIVLAGGAQAVAAMAYGTESVPKCDKIMGPGNQFVTAAKMLVSNDSSAMCAIDMPAGPSEVLVVADKHADPDFVASDLLSQAEHGVDSQVILIAVDMTSEEIDKIDDAVHRQALELPRVDIVRQCIAHSTTIAVKSYDDALDMSNRYAPEHLILQIEQAEKYVDKVDHAGSVFVGAYSPESCGDYSSGTNHTLPTYGYARMYSGVNTATFQKFITSQVVTKQGLKSIGKAVMDLAAVEGLDAHRNAVKIRMEKLGYLK